MRSTFVPVVLGSLLGAWVATAAAWQRVHVLVFVVGSLLAGVAVDYGFYLCLQPKRRPDERYLEKVSRLMRPLLASALTTVMGFSFLLWSELPLIRQLGVFVSAGLVCALVTALLWFAQVDDSYIETRDFVRRRPTGSGALARRAPHGSSWPPGAAVALLGPWRLHWKDDIRELEIPTPELKSNDAEVRALFGETPGRTVYLTQGLDAGGRRARSLQAFLDWHERPVPGRPGSDPRLRAADRGRVGAPARAARRPGRLRAGPAGRAGAPRIRRGRLRAVLPGVVRRAPAKGTPVLRRAGRRARIGAPGARWPRSFTSGTVSAGSPPSPSSRRGPTRPP